MTQIHRSALMDLPAEQMFSLVRDINAYSTFLPWCTHSTILASKERWVCAELKVRVGLLKAALRTHNELSPPDSICMTQVQGPFKSFRGIWVFTALSETASKTELALDFELQRKFRLLVSRNMLDTAANKVMDAFCEHAKLSISHETAH